MSRFADPRARTTIALGPCSCPGSPHDQDEATFRWQLGASALARIGRAELDGAVLHDPFSSYRQTVLEAVESWNLLWLDPSDDGDDRVAVPVPINAATVAEMDVDTLKFLAETADRLIGNEGSLPNVSGAPSADSSPVSASHTPKSKKRPTT